jgi:hypothetical protein
MPSEKKAHEINNQLPVNKQKASCKDVQSCWYPVRSLKITVSQVSHTSTAPLFAHEKKVQEINNQLSYLLHYQ